VPHKVIGVFDRVAPEHDQVLPFFAAMAEQAVSALPVRAGMRVLDLGAGTGAVAARLAAGARVTAVDAAPAMVARLRQDYPAADATVMDACELRFPDGAFDVVAAAFVMHLLDDPGAAAAEVRRVPALLGDAGFTDIGVSPLTVDLPMPGGGEMLWQWHLSHGTAAFIDDLPPDRRAEFRRRLIAETDAGGTRNLRLTASLWTGTLQDDRADVAP